MKKYGCNNDHYDTYCRVPPINTFYASPNTILMINDEYNTVESKNQN